MLYDYETHRIAFYRARYGEIEYYTINKDYHKTSLHEFIQLLGEDEYNHYFEQQKKWEEEQKIEKQNNESLIDCYNRLKAYLGANG